jgi:hypothetical protein
VAVRRDLFWQPDVGHDGKAELDKRPGIVSKGTHGGKPSPAAFLHEGHQQLGPQAHAATAFGDDERTDLRDIPAERRQLGAGDDPRALGGDQEPRPVDRQLSQAARQQMAALDVCCDEAV